MLRLNIHCLIYQSPDVVWNTTTSHLSIIHTPYVPVSRLLAYSMKSSSSFPAICLLQENCRVRFRNVFWMCWPDKSSPTPPHPPSIRARASSFVGWDWRHSTRFCKPPDIPYSSAGRRSSRCWRVFADPLLHSACPRSILCHT